MPSSPLPSLEQVLADRDDEVIFRFSEDFGVSFDDAEEVYNETLRWLWLCARRQQDFREGRVDTPRMPLASQAQVIDLMWHTFLLFTKEYSEFCDRHFGTFLHHFPLSRADKERLASEMKRDPEAFEARRLAELKPVYEYIHDVLGAEILIRWVDEFPEKYGSLSLSGLR